MPPEILTPRSAIDQVLAVKAKSRKFTLYDTTAEKIAFVLTVSLAGSGAVAGIVFYFSANPLAGLIGVALTLLSAGASIGYQLASLIPDLMKLKNPEQDFVTPHAQSFNEDIDLISELSSTHNAQHLLYAAQRFSLSAEQLRIRISLLVGAIDKVGIIPLSITTYFSAAKLIKEDAVFGGIEWAVITLVFLYLFAVRMSLVAQWLERTALIFRAAAEAKRRISSTASS